MAFTLKCFLCDRETKITTSFPVRDWFCWECREKHGFGIARTAEDKHARWKVLAAEREKRNNAT